jgi:hypothetical protein
MRVGGSAALGTGVCVGVGVGVGRGVFSGCWMVGVGVGAGVVVALGNTGRRSGVGPAAGGASVGSGVGVGVSVGDGGVGSGAMGSTAVAVAGGGAVMANTTAPSSLITGGGGALTRVQMPQPNPVRMSRMPRTNMPRDRAGTNFLMSTNPIPIARLRGLDVDNRHPIYVERSYPNSNPLSSQVGLWYNPITAYARRSESPSRGWPAQAAKLTQGMIQLQLTPGTQNPRLGAGRPK